MLLQYFTEEAYDKLYNDVDKNADKYSGDNEWLSEYFGGKNYFGTSQNVDVSKFTPYFEKGKKSDSQKNDEDFVNVRLMYDAFKNLTPLQASNKYMWSYLCHAIPEYWDYIQDRWMESARKNTIRLRYFVTDSASLRYNALSRLWWYGYLTYDANSSDPYDLTKILLMNQTICKDLMDTLNRTNFKRIKGVLTALKDFSETLEDSEGITVYFRECNKYLNHYAAVTNFYFLEAEEIHDLAYDYMVKLKENRGKIK